MICVLAGGIGAARFLRGLVPETAERGQDLTAVVNVGDDIVLHGLHVSPDLDTITYTLGGGIHPEQQWGRADESTVVAEELRRYGADETWFTLGDRDLALHLYRTRRLAQGAPLSQVTAEVTKAWQLPSHLTLLPATDDAVATHVVTEDGRTLHFQEYWVGERGAPIVERVYLDGADQATPGPGVVDAIMSADAVVLCPSNPIVSIGTILDVPGIREALHKTHAPIVGISPIVGGAVVRGMADKLMPSAGAQVSALGAAMLYADFLDGWIIDEADRAAAGQISDAAGVAVETTNTMMDAPNVARALAQCSLGMAARIGEGLA